MMLRKERSRKALAGKGLDEVLRVVWGRLGCCRWAGVGEHCKCLVHLDLAPASGQGVFRTTWPLAIVLPTIRHRVVNTGYLLISPVTRRDNKRVWISSNRR